MTSLISSRTTFDLFEVCYIIKSSPTATYSLLAVAHLLLQLLGLETLLSSTSNAFPRSLHCDCRFSVLDNSKPVGVVILTSQFPIRFSIKGIILISIVSSLTIVINMKINVKCYT